MSTDKKIFIAYSQEDFGFVKDVKAFLERNLPITIDIGRLSSINSYNEFMDNRKKIATNPNAYIFILISRNSFRYPWIIKEGIDILSQGEKISERIFPILIDSVFNEKDIEPLTIDVKIILDNEFNRNVVQLEKLLLDTKEERKKIETLVKQRMLIVYMYNENENKPKKIINNIINYSYAFTTKEKFEKNLHKIIEFLQLSDIDMTNYLQEQLNKGVIKMDFLEEQKQKRIEHLERMFNMLTGQINNLEESIKKAIDGDIRYKYEMRKKEKEKELEELKVEYEKLTNGLKIPSSTNNSPKADIIKILFLAASPSNQVHLQLDEELRIIEEKIRLSNYREKIELESKGAVRIDDIQQALLDYEPHIVHFSGHGTNNSEIAILDNQGKTKIIPQKALTNLFKILKDNIRCIILNACYASDQAEAIVEHIDCAIGMTNAISDEAAIKFSSGFYMALAAGKSIQTSFDLAVNTIELDGLLDEDIPKIHSRKGIDPSKIILVQKGEK